MLAAGLGFNISAAADLAYSASLPIDWLYAGGGVQIHRGSTHATLQNCESIITFRKGVPSGLSQEIILSVSLSSM